MTRTSLALLLIVYGALEAADAPTVKLTHNKQAQLSIVISEQASPQTKTTARDLAHYLGRLSGAEFKIVPGNGSEGIVLGRPDEFTRLPFTVEFAASPFTREEYILRSHGRGLFLIGATDLAVAHAAWDLLYRLGYRQFFPGATWEILPPESDLKVAISIRQTPAFYSRRIWYNWGMWGYNNEPYRNWCTRNRVVQGFELNSGHSYEAIIAANKAEFDQHPEYLAQLNGERKMRSDVKFCIANPGLRKLVVAHGMRSFQQNPALDSISMDPSDGGNWCECDDCGKIGSVSNRVLMLANEVAEAIDSLKSGEKYVGMYAYNHHSAPPTIKAHPNVIVSATTAFIGGGFTFDQVVDGWKKQGATIGVYDYFSVVDWDWNLPRGGNAARPFSVAKSLVKFHQQGARFFDAESGDCWGPCGLGYYIASRVMWDLNEANNVELLVEDYLEKAFGPAKEPMREFYRLINFDTQRRGSADLLARMYRQLDAARRITTDARITERLNHLLLYTHYAELYYALADGTGKLEDVARHAYRMRKTMMVHSYGLWARLLSQQAAAQPDHPLKNEAPFTADELNTILSNGVARYQPVEPGFESVEYSRELVPATPLKLAPTPLGAFPNVPQDRQHYYIWVPPGMSSVDLKVTVQKVWMNRQPKISLFSPLDVTLNAVATNESYKPDGKEYSISLKTPHTGLHRIETLDGGDYTRLTWPVGMPVTIETGIDTPHVTSHFRGGWTLYFYVPKGTKFVGGWASRIANWAPRISGKLLDPQGREMLDFGKCDEGWFKVSVPEGQDGKLWKFENSQGQRLLMTVPPYVARSAEELLLPVEIVKADAR